MGVHGRIHTANCHIEYIPKNVSFSYTHERQQQKKMLSGDINSLNYG